MGNLLPILFFLPLTALGIFWMHQNNAIFGRGLWLVVSGTILGWLALNLFGLWANGFMKRELKRELSARGIDFSDPHFFVGFATPKFVSILDSHEDLGYLFLRDSNLEFQGEVHQAKVPRNEIVSIKFRPNIHTWVGLGRWICIEGERKGKRYRMSIEPRERNFLIQNLIGSKAVKNRISKWRGEPK